MRPFEKKPWLKWMTFTAIWIGAAPGCLTPEEKTAVDATFAQLADPAADPITAPAPAPACFDERFAQPDAVVSRSIDLVFVMDTSGSMADNRTKVADGISAFVGELPLDVDYRIGVVLAHGSHSAWSGKVFTLGGYTVLDSQSQSLSVIQAQLRNMALNAPRDISPEEGEEGSYSLMKALTTQLAYNQSKGFFRPTAALAVVFVSDENDICAPYVGLPAMPGLTANERTLRNRDCAGGISTATVINQVKTQQGDRPYLFGAVTHVELGYTDQAGNDGYGYGYIDIVQASNGVSTEINDGSYTAGLSSMGRLATIKLNLLMDYTLARTNINASSIHAWVDGVAVTSIYDPNTHDVHLADGGGARSVVDVNYCLEADVVTPPTGNPTPSATPTPTCNGPLCNSGGGIFGT